MSDKIEEYLQLPYAVQVVPDATTDGQLCYIASHPDLPGCMAHGANEMEALANLDDARRLYIQTLLRRRLPVPRPEARTAGAHVARQEIIWTSAAFQPVRVQEPEYTRVAA